MERRRFITTILAALGAIPVARNLSTRNYRNEWVWPKPVQPVGSIERLLRDDADRLHATIYKRLSQPSPYLQLLDETPAPFTTTADVLMRALLRAHLQLES